MAKPPTSTEPKEPDSELEEIALKLCQLLRQFLHRAIVTGPESYRYEDEIRYRKMQRLFFEALRRDASLATFQMQAAKLFPMALSEAFDYSFEDWAHPVVGWQHQIILLQSQLVKALES